MNSKNYSGSKVISTKISPIVSDKMEKIAEKYKFGQKYGLLQIIIASFLRYADVDTEPSADLERLVAMYGNIDYLRDLFNIAHINFDAKSNIKSVIYVMEHENYKEQRPATFIVENEKVSFNAEKMLKIILENNFPTIYENLKILQNYFELDTISSTINYISKNIPNLDIIHKEVKEEFSDNERIGFGQTSLEYGEKFKSTKHYSIDTAHVNREETKTMVYINDIEEKEETEETENNE